MLSQGCFLQSNSSLGTLSTSAGAFLQERLPLFEVHGTVLPWLESWNVDHIRRISPDVVRTELKKLAASKTLTQGGLFTPAVAAELLLFATGDVALYNPDESDHPSSVGENDGAIDLDALSGCRGLPCLDAAGALQVFGSRTLYVLDSAKPDPTALFAHYPSVLQDFIHPEIGAAMASFFQRTADNGVLGVKQYSLDYISLHLSQILPSHWAPVGIGGDGPVSVRWRDGQMVRRYLRTSFLQYMKLLRA